MGHIQVNLALRRLNVIGCNMGAFDGGRDVESGNPSSEVLSAYH